MKRLIVAALLIGASACPIEDSKVPIFGGPCVGSGGCPDGSRAQRRDGRAQAFLRLAHLVFLNSCAQLCRARRGTELGFFTAGS